MVTPQTGGVSRGPGHVPEMTPERTPEVTGSGADEGSRSQHVSPYHTLHTYDTWKQYGPPAAGAQHPPQDVSQPLYEADESSPLPESASSPRAIAKKIRLTRPGQPSKGDNNAYLEKAERAQGQTRNSVTAALEACAKKFDEKRSWIQTSQADCVFGSAILLNAIMLGYTVDTTDPDDTGMDWVGWIIESIFLFVFITELYLRIKCVMPAWKDFFDGWGFFDLFVTVTSVVDNFILTFALAGSSDDSYLSALTVLRIFRLFRLIRIVRVLRMFRDLIVMIRGLSDSFRSVGWMSLLMLIIMYTGSIIVVILIGIPLRDENEDVDHFFGSVVRAMYSHFCTVTVEGWIDVNNTAMAESSWVWGIYFISLICFTNLVLLNLMVGCIVERIIVLAQEQELEVSEWAAESRQLEKTLGTLFKSSDMDANGEITYHEVRLMLDMPETKEILDCFGINVGIPGPILHTIMHMKDKEGVTTFKSFFDSILRLCGSKSNIHSMFVQHDVCKWENDITLHIDDLERKVLATVQRRKAPSPVRQRAGARAAPESPTKPQPVAPLPPPPPPPQEMKQEMEKQPVMQKESEKPSPQPALQNVAPQMLQDNKSVDEPSSSGGMTLAEEAAQLEELRRRMARCEAAQAQALGDVQDLSHRVAERNRVIEYVYVKKHTLRNPK